LTLDAAKIGLILPSEGRKLLEKSLGFDLAELNMRWVGQPIPFTMAALGVKAGPAEAVREQGRQEGNPPPDDPLTSDLGITTDANSTSRASDSGALTAFDAIEALNKPKND